MMRLRPLLFVCCAFLPAAALGQQAPFDEVAQNLRSPDPNIRLASVRLLREARHPQAVVPLAALVNDPVDTIQLEAIAAELSFFLVADGPATKDAALVVEARNPAAAEAAFDEGVLAVWPRPAPPELLSALLQAVDDKNARVRLEAIYAFGALAKAPLDGAHAQAVMKALDHQDANLRAAAALVVGRLGVKTAGDKLVDAINDSSSAVRHAAMRALGDLREQRGVQALADQFTYYGKGEGAQAALDALARIAHPSSVPLFRQRLADKDEVIRRAAAEGLGRAGDAASIATLELAVGDDQSIVARAAMSFALQKLNRNFVGRLVEFIESAKAVDQVDRYLLELGPPIIPALVPHLNDPSATIRAHIAQVLGVIGSDTTIPTLQLLTQDKDQGVARLATDAIQRIHMRGSQGVKP